MKPRPEFEKMLAAAARKEFDVIVLFAESLGDTREEMIENLRRIGAIDGVTLKCMPEPMP